MIPFPSSFLFRETSSSVVEGESPIRARAAGEAATLGIQGGGERSMGERGGGGREGKNSVLHFLARFSIAHPTTTTTILSPFIFLRPGKKRKGTRVGGTLRYTWRGVVVVVYVVGSVRCFRLQKFRQFYSLLICSFSPKNSVQKAIKTKL